MDILQQAKLTLVLDGLLKLKNELEDIIDSDEVLGLTNFINSQPNKHLDLNWKKVILALDDDILTGKINDLIAIVRS